MTCQQNWLPKKVEDSYLQEEKTVPKDPVAHAAKFKQPITLVTTKTKERQMPVIGAGDEDQNVQPTEITWTCVHVLFQSMSSTNISTVNALTKTSLLS
jgi:uncharacterized UBP type Zn finger protein